jgi:hypothetical protein
VALALTAHLLGEALGHETRDEGRLPHSLLAKDDYAHRLLHCEALDIHETQITGRFPTPYQAARGSGALRPHVIA